MKKSLLLFAFAMFVGGAASAQVDNTLQFVDASGNVVEDGATVSGIVEKLSDGTFQISTGLFVKNNSGERAGASVEVDITRIDNGKLSVCFPIECIQYDQVGSYNTTPGVLEVQAESHNFTTEWIPSAYGQCSASFKLFLHEVIMNDFGGIQMPDAGDIIAQGPSVTVNFVYDEESAGITGIETVENNEPVGYYTLDGQKLSAPRKGAVNIVKYANGKTAKTFVK